MATHTHKQVFWFSIINYVGVLIGTLSTLFVYPNNLEFLGEIRFIETIAQFLFPFFLFGLSNSLVNFYPVLSTSNQSKLWGYALRFILLSSISIGILLGLGVYCFHFFDYKYYFPAVSLAIALAYIELFKKKAAILQRIQVPTVLEKIIPKLLLPTLFFILFSFPKSSNLLEYVYALSYWFIAIITYLYLNQYFKGTFTQTHTVFDSLSKKQFYTFGFFAFTGSLGSLLAFRIDSFMIGNYISMTENGSYNIAVLLTSVIAIPATGLFAVNAPIISELIKTNQINQLQIKYQETAKFLFFVGAIALGIIIVAIEPFFKSLPTAHKLLPIIPIIYLLGINVLINMGTGFNSEIITFSPYYRFNIATVFVLVVLNILLNYLFLHYTTLQTQGVAIASLIALVVFNLAKLIFIYQKYRILPFNKAYLFLLLTMSGLTALIHYLPNTPVYLLTALYKSVLLVILTLTIVYKFKWIHLLNQFLQKYSPLK